MESVALHRNVEDVVKQYEGLVSADAAERQRTEGNIIFNGMEHLLKTYAECIVGRKTIMDVERILRDAELPILTPEQINAFLQETIAYENGEKELREKGEVIDWLIEQSYNAGHNHFVLNTKASCIPLDFCYITKGKKKQPLEITVEGPIGRLCGIASEYIVLSATSIGEQCAWRAKNLIINASLIGKECCEEGYGIVITADAIGAKCGKMARRCIFRTHNMKTLEKMKHSVERGRKNRIYLIHADGSEEEIPEEKWK